MLRIKGVLKKGAKWFDLIFEVEKFSIFQLQKLNQTEKKLLKHAFCAQHKTVCVKCQSRTKYFPVKCYFLYAQAQFCC
jgi:glutamyl/glutaminyl-tRNA synthetase